HPAVAGAWSPGVGGRGHHLVCDLPDLLVAPAAPLTSRSRFRPL
ncbi:adhesion protein, partial [Escherichia coli]|nr:adhesion protein [Escherichia coli]